MSDLSNDILVDRRFAWASALAAEGDFPAAADLLDQVVERAPGWAPGWAALAEARERSGTAPGALAAWRRAAVLDLDGRLGADLHVARLSGTAPTIMPEAYVRAVFDDYAPRFDRHLVDHLGYRGPNVLAQTLSGLAPGRRYARALDLGCGTGLMGRAITASVAALDGVDLSPRMVEGARATGLYDTLSVGTIERFLGATPAARYDLVLAADVLAYLGDLAPVMAGVMRILQSGGLFGFTLQRLEPDTASDDRKGYGLGRDMRFAYAPSYIEASCGAAGLRLLALNEDSVRTEAGRAVPGLIAVAAL